MNTFNRIVLILFSFLLFAFGLVTLLLLTGLVVPDNSYLRSILTLYNAWRAIAFLRGTDTNLAVLIALALTVVGSVLLILELLPMRRLFRQRETKQYVVRQDALGKVTVGRSMVHDVAKHVAESVPGVLHAEPQVHDGADGLHVVTSAALAWDTDAPSVGQELQERIKESVQTQLGLPVAEVRVAARSAPPAKEQRRRVA